MTRDSRLPEIALVVACQANDSPAASDAARSILAQIRQAGLTCLAAVDEAGLSAIAAHAPLAASRLELAAIMPSSKESASLESRLQACREMSANADAVFLPVGGSLHGARADLARLGVGTVIDVAGLVGRRPLPFHVLRMAVDAVAPAASWWRRFAKLPLKPLLASRGHSATVVLDAALMAKTGAMGRRQVSCAVEMLRQAQGEGVIQIVTLHESAALRTATRRSASQQSILRAA